MPAARGARFFGTRNSTAAMGGTFTEIVLKAVHGLFHRFHRPVAHTGAAKLFRVRVQQFRIGAGVGHAKAVIGPQHRCKVCHTDNLIAAFVPAQEHDDALG